jgi:hypothetical protein
VLAIGVIASATFILISVDAFRLETPRTADRRSGVGGYSLLVDLLVPIAHDPNSRAGRDALGLADAADIAFVDRRKSCHGVDGRGRHLAKSEIHVVQPRETVGTIAKRYGISAAELTRWNELDEGARIRPGDKLRIASAASSD